MDRVVCEFVYAAFATGGNRADDGSARFRGIGFDDVCVAIASPNVPKIVRDDAIWTRA
jgi:hypothetical protein